MTDAVRKTVEARLGAMTDVVPADSWGERAFFVNPGRLLPRGVYFATVKTRDGPNDAASNLSRDGVWRLSLGLPRPLYLERFGPPPRRPAKGRTVDGSWDFEALDRLEPHPIYAWMGWAAVLSPRSADAHDLPALIEAAHAKASAGAAKRLSKG